MSGAFGDLETRNVIVGGTDDTIIGNVSDALKVTPGSITGQPTAAWGSSLRWQDMNASNGGVARGTAIGASWTTLYSKSGSGYLLAWLATVELLDTASAPWSFRLIIDGGDMLLGANGINASDVMSASLYNTANPTTTAIISPIGITARNNTIMFQAPMNMPIKWSSSMSILAYKAGVSKNFLAGLASVVIL